jgi:hypothetical protein
MRGNPIRHAMAALIITTLGLSVPVLAQSEDSESLHCPEGYTLVGSECVNSDGDVVKPQ